jgi:hypothetical protein
VITIRKLIALTALIFFTAAVSGASIDSVDFREIPTAWESDQSLDFHVDIDGSALDTVVLQSREPGEIGFRDRKIKQCTNYGDCSWSFEHQESNERAYEYRFRVFAGEERGNSRKQTIRYYDNLNYYLNWVETPPDSASSGSTVEMSVSAYDSAGRFDTEGVLNLQYRSDSGTWKTFDSLECSNSEESNRCSNWGETELNNNKIQYQDSDFRGRIVFEGGVKADTGTRTVSVSSGGGEDEASIDYVYISDLPETVQEGSSFPIRAEASGEELDKIIIQERNPDEAGWEDWRSYDCSGTYCSFSRNFDVEDTGGREFRARAWAGDERENSDTEYVDFADSASINQVTLDELSSHHPENTDLDISGDASGNKLDRLRLMKRRDGSIDWNEIKEEDCGNSDSCEIRENDFQSSSTGQVTFQIWAYAGGQRKDSNMEVVEFTQEEDEERVEDVRMDDLPEEHPTGEDMDVTGDAEGRNLDSITLQKRDPGDDWEEVTSQDCDNDDSCDFSYDYSQNDEEEVDFRLKAEAGSDSMTSYRQTVDFIEESDEGSVDDVNIDDQPSSHPVNEELDVSGDASGEKLDRIEIQYREEGDSDWNELEDKDCDNEDSCSISDSYTANSEEEMEFRIKAYAGDDSDTSGTETVEFVDEGAVDDVSIEDLPSSHPVDNDLRVSGDATGDRLDRIEILYREEGTWSWNELDDKDCGNSDSCSIEEYYTADSEESIEFRIKAYAGDDSSVSGFETVDFVDEPDREVRSVSIDSLPSSQETGTAIQVSGDASGTNLESIYIEKRTSGSWSEVDSSSCSEDSCSISTDFSTPSDGDVDFRVGAEAGSDSGTSSVETVSFYTPVEPEVTSVSIENLPAEHPVNDDLWIEGEASGAKLDSITIQKKPSSGGSWTEVESESCSGSSCSISAYFTEPDPTGWDFRVRAEAGSDSDTSGTESVDFVLQEDIVSVEPGNLPNSYPARTDLEISGTASGTKLDSLKLMRRYEGSINWDDIETVDCGDQSSCSLDVNFSSGAGREIAFKLKARAGDRSEYSDMKVVRFTRAPPGESIDSVDLEAPDEANTSEDITLSASAEGQNLDELYIQQEVGISWANLQHRDCGDSDECSLDITYSSETSGEQDFRARAYAGDKSENSETETVEFLEPVTPPEIQDVDINSLPSEHPTGEALEILGDAEGSDLQRIEIQKREESETSWETIRTRDCGGSDTCETSRSYTSTEEITEEFRVVAFLEDSNSSSNIETVEFIKQQAENGPNVDSVDIEDLPNRYETGRDLDISAEASGTELDTLTIQRRRHGSISWANIAEKDCVNSTDCSLTREDFQGSGQITFRARAVAGTDVEYSSLEVVEFYRGETGDEDDARLRVIVDDEDDDPLENARIDVSNGDDRTRYTDEDGETEFWLEPGDYSVEASKNGYESENRDVELEEDERRTVRFELEDEGDRDEEDEDGDIQIIREEYSENVCRGEDLRVRVVIENTGAEEDVAVWGTGLGGADSIVKELEDDSVTEVEIFFENLQDTGSQEFTVYVENSERDSRTRTVEVDNCGEDEREATSAPTGLTAQADRKVLVGKTLKVSGDVIGATTPQEVTVEFDGESRTVSSARDGNFQAFLTAENVGTRQVEVTAAGFSRTRTVEVVPSAEIDMIDMPRKVFEGETFQACAEIDSQIDARVILESNGRTLAAKNGRGRVCFDIEAGDTGKETYRFRALTYGTGSDAEKQITVLEAGEEFSTFPDRVAMVETEPGIVKTTIYNRRNSTTSYNVDIQRIDERWVSATSKNVVLPRGEKETVYFYFTPRSSGDYRPTIVIEAEGEEVYTESIILESAEAGKNPQESLIGLLTSNLGL